MTKATERQICQVGGSLLGWLTAQIYDKNDTVPFTIIGGLIGFVISQEVIGESPTRYTPSELKGLPKKRKRKK